MLQFISRGQPSVSESHESLWRLNEPMYTEEFIRTLVYSGFMSVYVRFFLLQKSQNLK